MGGTTVIIKHRKNNYASRYTVKPPIKDTQNKLRGTAVQRTKIIAQTPVTLVHFTLQIKETSL